MSRRTVLALSVIFVGFISLPILLMVFGQRSSLDQNREIVAIERPSLDSIGDGSWFSSLNAAFEDRLPLRPEAVVADAWVDVKVLSDSPSDDVVAGEDGWLFFTESLMQPCPTGDSSSKFLGEVQEAQRIVESAGKRLVLAFAPDKGAIYTDKVGHDVPCVTETAELLDQAKGVGAVSVLHDLRNAKETEDVYHRLDTHWNTLGASYLARGVIDALKPGMWSDASLQEVAVKEHEGDLTRMQGLARSEEEIVYRTEREGSQTEINRTDAEFPDGTPVPGLQLVGYSTDGADSIGGDTLVLHDSFGWALMHSIASYFSDAVFVRRTDPGLSYTRSLVEEADTIVLEIVQRAALDRVVAHPISEAFAAALSDYSTISAPSAPMPDGDVVLSNSVDREYVFFELGVDADEKCEVDIEGRETMALDRVRPRIAVRLVDSLVASTECPGLVSYWQGTFGVAVGW